MSRQPSPKSFTASLAATLLLAACGGADFANPVAQSDAGQAVPFEAKEIGFVAETQPLLSPGPGDSIPAPALPPNRPNYNIGNGNDVVRISKWPGYTGEIGWHRVEINGQVSTFTKTYLESIEFYLGEGDDTFIVEPDVDADIHANGGPGNDTMYGGAGNDMLNGWTGNDIIYGRRGNDTLIGSIGDDEIHGGRGADYIYGMVGNNRIWGNGGNDHLRGGTGNDVIFGGTDDDYIDGLHGNDRLEGGKGADIIHGSFGDDVIRGDEGDDRLWGGPDDDSLFGGPGVDQIHGGYYVAPGQPDYGGGPGDDTIDPN